MRVSLSQRAKQVIPDTQNVLLGMHVRSSGNDFQATTHVPDDQVIPNKVFGSYKVEKGMASVPSWRDVPSWIEGADANLRLTVVS